jgi:hypothetical protein
MLTLAMLCYALPAVRSWPALRRWLATLCTQPRGHLHGA